MFLGSRLGGMLSAPVALLIIARWGWRESFVIFGLIGVVWAAAWYAWYRDRPEEHPAMTSEELAQINDGTGAAESGAGTPWRALLRSRNLYAICAMYFAFGYGLYFYFTWLPTYLLRELHFSLVTSGVFASLPFVLAGGANLAGGWTTDRLARAGNLRSARVGVGAASFATCAGLVILSTIVSAPVAKAVLLALALASADFALGACWAVCLDVGAAHAGVVTGFMNTFGNLGGLVGPLVVSLMVEHWQSWTYPFYVTAAVYAMGAAAWLAIDPHRRVA